MLKRLAIALSLANLWMFGVWANVLPSSPWYYLHRTPPTPALLAATVGALVVLAAAFLAVYAVVRRLGGGVGRWAGDAGLLLAVAIALNAIRQQVPLLAFPPALLAVARPLTAALAVALFAAFARWRRGFRRAIVTLLLIASPFVAVTVGQVAWALLTYDRLRATFADRPVAPPVNPHRPAAVRVIWHVFDELDQRFLFDERPPGLELPEIDGLRATALHATQAYPPAAWTLQSLPALLIGELVSKATAPNPAELLLTLPARGTTEPWSRLPNVFSAAREAGFNSALMGEYHPYCRVLAHSLTACTWQAHRRSPDLGFAGSLTFHFTTTASAIPLVRGLKPWDRLQARFPSRLSSGEEGAPFTRYRSTLARALALATDPSFDLVLVHWPIPHGPGIFDAASDSFRYFTRGTPGGYAGNLELVDGSLREVRLAVEAAGLAGQTATLVTSDHGYRVELWKQYPGRPGAAPPAETDHRVPFLLKLPGQEAPIPYARLFNTVITKELLLALLEGRVRTPEAAAAFLDEYGQPVRGYYQTVHPLWQ
jgi:hypothetical protein